MNLEFCIRQLAGNASSIYSLTAGVDGKQARWKPSPHDWSILEVINHLLDEESEDFRSRIQHLLSGSLNPWPPIAPEDWVTDRFYNQRALAESLDQFLIERRHSVAWLSALRDADWETRYTQPPLEGIAAGDVLVSWPAHDLLHMRQLLELKWSYGQIEFAPYSSDYAGEW
jgi:hypothetical protein